MTDKMREEFEGWQIENMQKHGISEGTARASLARKDGEYGPYVAQVWMVWQASRAALVVELPSVISAQYNSPATDAFDRLGYENGVRSAIEAAGVKVKA